MKIILMVSGAMEDNGELFIRGRIITEPCISPQRYYMMRSKCKDQRFLIMEEV